MHVASRPMDATELARWTRFAAKGGIGKCIATGDCVAEAAEDLMFLKNDEIVVLLQLPDEDNVYLGYCEGIVGRFRASDVHFHSKLKKPVMTKRSSVSASVVSGKSTPTPSLAQSPIPSISPKSDSGFQNSNPPSPHSQLRYQPSPSPTLTASSSREHLPRSSSYASTTATSFSHSASTSTSMSTSLSSSSLSSFAVDTPATVYSSPEPVLARPLDASASTASMDTNVSGRSSTHMASSPSSLNGPESEGDTEVSPRRNRRSETAAVEMWPVSPSSALTRKPVNSSRLAVSVQPPDSDESDGGFKNGHGRGSSDSDEEDGYDPEDGGWASVPNTLPLQVVKLSTPNSIPPSPYQPFTSSSSVREDEEEEDPISHSVNGSIRSASESDSASEYDTTDPEDVNDETTKFTAPSKSLDASTPSLHQSTSSRHSMVSVESQQYLSRAPSTHSTQDESMQYGNDVDSPMHEASTRSSVVAPSFHGSEDGEMGIGLSLLSGLAADEDDDEPSDDEDEAPMFADREKIRQSVSSAARGAPRGSGDDWDGASIYENYYRFSRFSTNPRSSSSTFASKMSKRFSHSSHRAIPASVLEAVPPVPADLRTETEKPERSDKTRSVDSDASVYTQASKISSIDPSRLSVRPPKNDHRPESLDLVNSLGEPSPLLHTRWGSPVSSSSPPSSSAAAQTTFFQPSTSPGSPSSGSISPGGAASMLRQQLELERASPAGSHYTELTTAEHEGEGLGDRIVVEDDEEPPVTPITDAPQSESPEEEPEAEEDQVVDAENDTEKTKSGLESLTPLVINDSLSPGSANSTGPLSASPSPQSAVSSATTTPLSPSSPPDISPPPQQLQPQHQLRPSLSELRGYAAADNGARNNPVQRTSLFLPHPNAPKPPPATGAPEGPMYIRSPQPPAQQQAESVINVIKMSLGRSQMTRVRPTIYGRIDGDFSTATGPVRVVFSVDPPPPSAMRPSQIPFRNGAPAGIAPPPPPPPVPPMRRTTGESEPSPVASSPSTAGSSTPRGPPTPVRSPSTGPSPASAVPTKSSPLASEKPTNSPEQRSGVIPRSNFFPKAGTVRPRSRSFSGFNTSEISAPIPISREEGSGPLKAPIAKPSRSMSTTVAPTSNASPSLSPLPPSSPSPPQSLNKHTSRSSLRSAHAPSPLSLPHNNSVLGVRPAGMPRSPTSPLAMSPVGNGNASSPLLTRPAHQLRQMTSRSTLNEGTHVHRPSLSRTGASDSPAPSPVHTRNESLMSSTPDRPSLEFDSNRVLSPTGTRESLRQKLSLPNLRRNQSRQSSDSGSHNETVQVESMDFELIRPNLAQLQQASGRSSEDSSLGARDASVDGRTSNIGDTYRTDSPAFSIASNQAPWSSSSETSIDAHRQRELKWVSLMGTVLPAQARKSKKVKKLLMDGSVPSSVRFLVWSHLTDSKAKGIPGVYAQLGKRARVPALNIIDQDVQRCLTDHLHGQSTHSSLMTLLQAYLTMVPDVQYSLGLTLIAGHLLALSPEEDAFWIFVSIMDSYLRPYFSPNTTQLEVDSALFSRALEANDPQVAKKVLMDMSINPVDLCRPWFSTMFVDALPLDYLNRVWDLFLYEGIPFLFRVALALFQCCRRRILEAINQEALFQVLSNPPPNLLPPSPDALIALVFSVKLKDDDIRKQRVKMEAQVKRQTQNPRAKTSRSVSVPRN